MGSQKIHPKHGRTRNVIKDETSASKAVSRACQLCSYQGREGNFFEVLFSIKVPTGFSSKIKGIVNMKEKKF
jgi:hypothetical protein